ncbi:hypothetical protein ACOSQ3_014308 [Xanthoceras sorbifolium]
MLLRYERLPEYWFSCGYVGYSFRECPEDRQETNGGVPKSHKFVVWLRASSPTKSRGSASNIRDYGGRTPSTEADSQGRRRNANMERMKKGSEGGIIEDFGIQKIGERSLEDPDTMAA